LVGDVFHFVATEARASRHGPTGKPTDEARRVSRLPDHLRLFPLPHLFQT
jgi:hypothetical protein